VKVLKKQQRWHCEEDSQPKNEQSANEKAQNAEAKEKLWLR
jgi:hypothetical protein